MIVHSVDPHSPAEIAGLLPHDHIILLNGRDNLEDMFDYQFEIMGETSVSGEYTREGLKGPQPFTLDLSQGADAGLVFTSPLFTPIKTCNNACPFCFIDQQPDGLRASLYVKDDDWRLSYFSHTYITLTNLTEHDRDRMRRIRPGPLYVSVHSTVPDIRIQMLKNPKFAGKIMDELRWLQSVGIPFHCQVVVCPGINDSDEALNQTLNDLWSLAPDALSVAVIPVGLTQYRENLDTLSPIEATGAKRVIDLVEDFRAKNPEADEFVFLSDEFYHQAGMPLPTYAEYGEFEVLEDGVGTARMLIETFYELEPLLPAAVKTPKKVIIATGQLAAMTLDPIVRRLNEIEHLYLDCVSVDSQFWGKKVDVAGLITGQDILDALSGQDVDGYDVLLIPSVMLKEDTELFLDGRTVTELSDALGVAFEIIEDPYHAKCLLEHLHLI